MLNGLVTLATAPFASRQSCSVLHATCRLKVQTAAGEHRHEPCPAYSGAQAFSNLRACMIIHPLSTKIDCIWIQRPGFHESKDWYYSAL